MKSISKKQIAGLALVSSLALMPATSMAAQKISESSLPVSKIGIGKTVDGQAVYDNLKSYLPSGTKIEIMSYPDTSKEGRTTASAILIFSDGDTQNVTIPLEVVKKTTQNTTTEDKVEYDEKLLKVKDEQIESLAISEGGSITEKMVIDAIHGKPDGAKFTITSMPTADQLSKPGVYSAKIRVEFFNKSTQDVIIPVKVLSKNDEALNKKIFDYADKHKSVDKEVNQVITKDTSVTTTNNNNQVSTSTQRIKPSQIIKQVVNVGDQLNFTNAIKDLPSGTKIKVISQPETNVVGEFKAVLEVTFSDGYVEKVDVPVEVRKNVDQIATTKGEPIKGDPQKGEMVKTGDEVKKSIIGGVSLLAVAGAIGAFYFRKFKKAKQ